MLSWHGIVRVLYISTLSAGSHGRRWSGGMPVASIRWKFADAQFGSALNSNSRERIWIQCTIRCILRNDYCESSPEASGKLRRSSVLETCQMVAIVNLYQNIYQNIAQQKRIKTIKIRAYHITDNKMNGWWKLGKLQCYWMSNCRVPSECEQPLCSAPSQAPEWQRSRSAC